MGVQRTSTIKSKHAANGSGIKGSKASKSGSSEGASKTRSKPAGKSAAAPLGRQVKGQKIADILKKKKKRVYTEKELGIPQLNMITPIGVTKPKGKKKGKVFVDDKVR
jgi:60S ribosomal subunit assembly/export protein LOC1